MGYSSSNACYPVKADALADWCAHVTPGSTASSCQSCDDTTSTCAITYSPSNSASAVVSTVSVYTPSCEVPTPVADAAVYSGAIVSLWVTVWAAAQLYKFFRVPHADNS